MCEETESSRTAVFAAKQVLVAVELQSQMRTAILEWKKDVRGLTVSERPVPRGGESIAEKLVNHGGQGARE